MAMIYVIDTKVQPQPDTSEYNESIENRFFSDKSIIKH